MTDASSRKTVAVAGAAGFVGRHLPVHAGAAGGTHRLIGLTRNPHLLADGAEPADGYAEWRPCDLFSYEDALRALGGADVAVYSVHSARPSARLTQGSVRDLDLICADNFARAAREHGLEHIVNVAGWLPEESSSAPQLAHRREVHETLAASGVAVTSLRASFIIGPGSISARVLTALVRRLPVMVLPSWASIPTRPVAVDDMVELVWAFLDRPDPHTADHTVGGSEAVSFRQMLERTAEAMGKKRRFFSVPVAAPGLATAWMRLFTGVSGAFIRQFVAAFEAEGQADDFDREEGRGDVVSPTIERELGHPATGFSEAIARAVGAAHAPRAALPAGSDNAADPSLPARRSETLPARQTPRRGTQHVRSVQRMPLPAGKDARWVAEQYPGFLVDLLSPFLRVEIDSGRHVRIFLRPVPWPLLEMRRAEDLSTPDRQLYRVTGGLLAADHEKARLEFREVMGGRWVIAGLHEFEPALPWLVYRFTQALMHLWVMGRFAGYLESYENTE